jgi:hypothetical protein
MRFFIPKRADVSRCSRKIVATVVCNNSPHCVLLVAFKTKRFFCGFSTRLVDLDLP